MEAVMGGMSLGGQLKRLDEDYDLVKKKRPILSKEGSQTAKPVLQSERRNRVAT